MLGITEDELQRVPPRREVKLRFGLSTSEMQMLPVRRDRLLWIRQPIHVHEEMMMPDVRCGVSGTRHPCYANQSGPKTDFSPSARRAAK